MSYLKGIYSTSTDSGAAIISAIKSQLASADGWSTADGGTTYTNSSSGVTLSVAFPFTTIQTGGMIELSLNGRSVTVLAGNTSLTNTQIGIEVSCGADFFYLCASGPAAGQTGGDATYGSPTGFAMLTTVVPYFTSDGTPDDKICVISTNYSTAAATSAYAPGSNPPSGMMFAAYIKKGLNATSWDIIEFATMRPAVQDVVVIGDLLPNKQSGANLVYWPFVVIERSSGLRGRLKNVFFGGDNYLLGSEISVQLHDNSNVLINGLKYVRSLPASFPNSTNIVTYSPLGVCTNVSTQPSGVTSGGWSTVGGPNIIIKKGNGS